MNNTVKGEGVDRLVVDETCDCTRPIIFRKSYLPIDYYV
jgi:hypothetical protein